MDLPIACTLSEAELQQRRHEILDCVRAATLKTSELRNGYAYELPFGSDTLIMLARLVALEHGCCPFLTFRIALEAGAETVTLEVTASFKAKPVIANFFGGSR
jgi:hypothetical protein